MANKKQQHWRISLDKDTKYIILNYKEIVKIYEEASKIVSSNPPGDFPHRFLLHILPTGIGSMYDLQSADVETEKIDVTDYDSF